MVNLQSDQGEHQFGGVGDIIFHASVKFKLDIQSHPGGVRGWQLKEVMDRDLESRQAAVCLAATLSIKDELPIAVRPGLGEHTVPYITFNARSLGR